MDFIEVDAEGLCIGFVGAIGFGLFFDGFVLSVGFVLGGFVFGWIGFSFRFRSRLFWAFLLHCFDRFIDGPIA